LPRAAPRVLRDALKKWEKDGNGRGDLKVKIEMRFFFFCFGRMVP
jgi:hypothetical protein